MQQGLRRNSLIVIAARTSGVSSRAAATQKLCSPGWSRRPLRASLITLVSINNISSCRLRVLALDIGIQTDIRHGRQQLRQLAERWAQQRRRQDGPEFGFLAAAMGHGPPLQGLHEGIINAGHQQVSQGVIPLLIAMQSTVHGPLPDS
jgi:hypothetical protein